MTGMRGGELSVAAFGLSTDENRKLVNPTANTLSTTPTMIWLTRYFTVNSASSDPMTRPATGAATRPAYTECVTDATTAAPNAPVSS